MSYKFLFLSNEFYDDYPNSEYSEIERKVDRPYIQVGVKINGNLFAIPLRSHIRHRYVFWTNKDNRCGLDFSKAIVIVDEKYIDEKRKPFIRDDEFKELMGKEYIIKTKMEKYIEKYKNAKANPQISYNASMVSMSTLQYFEEYI